MLFVGNKGLFKSLTFLKTTIKMCHILNYNQFQNGEV